MVKKINLEDAYTLSSPDDNVRLYSKWAATYDADFAQNSDYILPNQVAKAVHAIKKTGRVLDLGAGTGLLAAELLKIGKYKVDATDISEDMLRTAAKRTYMSDFSGVTLLPGQTPQMGPMIFAPVLGTFTHGLVGPYALNEVLRVVKKGGSVVFSVNLDFWKLKAFDVAVDRLRKTVHRIDSKYDAIAASS